MEGRSRSRGEGQGWGVAPASHLPTNAHCAHSWAGRSPGARATLLWSLAAAVERRGPSLTTRLERQGVEPKAAKAEVELSVQRLRTWGARAQVQGDTMQVRGKCGQVVGAGVRADVGVNRAWKPAHSSSVCTASKGL